MKSKITGRPWYGRFFQVFFITALLIAAAVPTFAYQEDTHFLMTYVICRSAGFTAEEALTIAAVDQGMDDSPDVNAHNGAVPHVAEEWIWHALDKDGKMGAAGVIARRDQLFHDALIETDPKLRLIRLGIFFHFQQDTWAHRHHEKADHLSRTAYTTFNTPTGHSAFGDQPDRPPIDPVAAFMCLEDGIAYAGDFLKRALGREPNSFFIGFVPVDGKEDAGWNDRRKGKYFNQIELAGSSVGSAGYYLKSLVRAQIDAYTASIDANPNYFGRQTPDLGNLDKVRASLQKVCDTFQTSVGPIKLPTAKEKLAAGFDTDDKRPFTLVKCGRVEIDMESSDSAIADAI